jgi:hypothetical protein
MSLLRTLSSLMRTREGLPGQLPIAPSQACLTLEFFCDGLPEKKLQLIGMSTLINPIKPWAGMSQCDGRVAGQTCIKALAEAGRLHGHQLLFLCDVEIRSSTRVSGDVRVMRLGPRTSRSWTCRARQRLVVQGGDLSCEAETGSSSGKLVGDATNWLKTGSPASEGLDEDLHSTTQEELQANGGLLLDVVVSKGTTILKLLASKQWNPP